MADDVQWLRSQGGVAEKSFMFLVDSSMRDVTAWPTPSEYVVTLPMPLRNVFAVDLVDATIPRTEYSVERDSCSVVFAVSQAHATVREARAAGVALTARVVPGDYTLVQLVESLSAAMVTTCLQAGVVPVRVEHVSNPSELTNRVRFICSSPFAVFMDASPIRHVVGFGNPAHAPLANVGADGALLYTTTPSTKQDVFFSTAYTAPGGSTPAFAGPVAVNVAGYSESLDATTTLSQAFTAAESGAPAGILVKGTATRAGVLDISISRLGNVVASTSVNVVVGADTWLATFSGGAMAPLMAGTVYTIECSTEDSLSIFRAETFTDDVACVLSRDGQVISTTDALSIDITVATNGHALEAPGQCDLTGERYVLIRSPDIEQHLHRNLACAFDRMAPGLGMCKLGGFGFREERFNFLAYSTRTFHPIGKLRELRIRLEKRDGRLYNSHGINHVLLFVVKMYAPAVPDAMMVSSSMLNPKYTPDIRRSLVAKLERERD